MKTIKRRNENMSEAKKVYRNAQKRGLKQYDYSFNRLLANPLNTREMGEF